MTSSFTRAGADSERSLLWRCRLCGRLHLFVEPSRHPVACHDCGSDDFASSSPGESSWRVTSMPPDASDAVGDDLQTPH